MIHKIIRKKDNIPKKLPGDNSIEGDDGKHSGIAM